MKLKLKGAQTGHSLLKRKSEALTKRFRGITVKIDEVLLLFFLSRVPLKYFTRFRFICFSLSARWVKLCNLLLSLLLKFSILLVILGTLSLFFSFFLLLRFTIYTQNKNKKSADEINFFFFFFQKLPNSRIFQVCSITCSR